MKIPFFPLILLFVICAMFTSCSDGDEGEPTPQEQQKLVIAMFSPGGLGDRGYNDLVLYGLQTVHKEHPECAMLFESPHTMEDAERIFTQWLDTQSSGIPCMFILASAEYEEMAQRVLAGRRGDMTNKAILLYETDTEFPYPQVYTFKINMYGASYMAGACVAEMGLQSPLIMLGSSCDMETRSAADGFIDGYRETTGREAELGFFADDWSGYIMSQHAYEMMPELSRGHDFIFPVAGGTNLGIYRYLRDHPDGPLVAGMDIDQSPFSNNIVGSLVKHIDRLVIDGITAWLDNPVNDRQHVEFGLESGYIDWQLSDRYTQYAPIVEENRKIAIDREHKYEAR